MIPLRDLLPSRTFPVVNTVFIVVNCLAFVFSELILGAARDPFIEQWGLVPLTLRLGNDPQAFVTVVTSMFLHGGWMHVIGNMWFLYIFGDNVEDAMGHVRYPIFYLLCGAGAAAGQFLVDPSSKIPMIGASGAIAGVLGAYLSLYPRARIVTLIPIFVFIQIAQLPAFVVILLWFVLQVLQGLGALGMEGGGTAWWAHIGGFVVGFVLIRLFVKRGHTRSPEDRPASEIRRRIDWH